MIDMQCLQAKQFTKLEYDETFPEHAVMGLEYKHFAYSPAEYIVWLANRLRSKGVSFQKIQLRSLADVLLHVENVTAIFNCSNFGFATLEDVKQEGVKPEHQYIAYIDAPWVEKSRTMTGPGDSTSPLLISGPD